MVQDLAGDHDGRQRGGDTHRVDEQGAAGQAPATATPEGGLDPAERRPAEREHQGERQEPNGGAAEPFGPEIAAHQHDDGPVPEIDRVRPVSDQHERADGQSAADARWSAPLAGDDQGRSAEDRQQGGRPGKRCGLVSTSVEKPMAPRPAIAKALRAWHRQAHPPRQQGAGGADCQLPGTGERREVRRHGGHVGVPRRPDQRENHDRRRGGRRRFAAGWHHHASRRGDAPTPGTAPAAAATRGRTAPPPQATSSAASGEGGWPCAK